MTNREQAIRRVADELRINVRTAHGFVRRGGSIAYAVDTTEKLLAAEARVLELEAALKELIFASRGLVSEAYINEARAALQPKGE